MESKPWYKSLGEWASISIAFFGLLLPIIGKADYAKFLSQESAGIVEWFSALGILIGSALAFYGRWRATTKITT